MNVLKSLGVETLRTRSTAFAYIKLGEDRIYVRVSLGKIVLAERQPPFGSLAQADKWRAG